MGAFGGFFSRTNQHPSALSVAHHAVLLLAKSAEMDGWMTSWQMFLAGWNSKLKLNSFKDTFVAVFRLDLVYLLKIK